MAHRACVAIVCTVDGHRALCLLQVTDSSSLQGELGGCGGSVSLSLSCTISLPRLFQDCSPFPPPA